MRDEHAPEHYAAPRSLGLKMPLMATPLRLYSLLLCTIFLSDLLQSLFLPLNGAGRLAPLVDAAITTLCGAPLLWLLVVRPLKNAVSAESLRIEAVRSQVIDALIEIDLQGVIGSYNLAAERIFGYPAAQMLGQSAAQLFDLGEQGLAAVMAGASASGPGEPTPSLLREVRCRHRDGWEVTVDLSVIEFPAPGDAPQFLLIMRDITDRKRIEEALRDSETRFKEIFHQSEEAILFFKPGSCVILDANETAIKLFGFTKNELQGGALERVMGEELPALVAAVSGIGAGSTLSQEFHCRRKNQEQMVVAVRGKTMLLQEVPITCCTFRDITERLRVEEKTRDLQARLIQTNKMTSLGLLVSGVAHEINNPNNFIMANAELLSRISEDSLKVLNEYSEEHPENGEFYIAGIPFSELGKHSRKLFDGIAVGSHRVNDIVNNLKGFARQERRQAMREIDVNEVARSAVSLLHHELIRHTDNFHLDLAATVPPVTGHSQQLGQVIINLLMNACQALPERQKGIWLSTRYDVGQQMVMISVRDEGVGMAREDSRRIMEPFFTTKLDDGGTGLGLSISDSIVKEHGGCLDYHTEPGFGTTFEVWLPAAEKEQKPQP